MVRARVLVMVVLLLLAGCTGRRLDRTPEPAPTSSSATPGVPVPEGQSTGAVTVGGQQRTYRLYPRSA